MTTSNKSLELQSCALGVIPVTTLFTIDEDGDVLVSTTGPGATAWIVEGQVRELYEFLGEALQIKESA